MLFTHAHWLDALRDRMQRHALENELLELASRLPDEPECRCAYQRLLDEHMQRAARGSSSADRPRAGVTRSLR
jgi:hypothetical protein